jgi:hypothetical protein
MEACMMMVEVDLLVVDVLILFSKEDMRTTDWRNYLESNEGIWSI